MAGVWEVEWLDADPLPPDEVPRGRGPRFRWWYLAVAALLLAAVVVATRPGHPRQAAARPTPSPSPSRSRSPSNPPTPNAPVQFGPPTVTKAPGPLLDVAPTWQLFGRASDAVVGLQLATGRVTVTPIPLLSSAGPASFVVGPGDVIVRPYGAIAGYDVPDGGPAVALSGIFLAPGPAAPGPDPAHLWVRGTSNATMNLVGFDGTSTGVSLQVPPSFDAVDSDADGYLLFYGPDGVFDARPTGLHRITTGALLAIGPTAWLTVECDGKLRCATTVIDRVTGTSHTIGLRTDRFVAGGVISPDGNTAAVFEGDHSQPMTLHLVDLATGADRATTVTVDPDLNYQDGLFIWSPDSRWIFATNGIGRIYAINADTGLTTSLPFTAGPVSQLALRVG